MFSNKDLRRLIVPLFLEQFLVILVGLADTFVISFAGEAASQLLMISTLFSVGIMVVILLFGYPLLRLLFGKVEKEVDFSS